MSGDQKEKGHGGSLGCGKEKSYKISKETDFPRKMQETYLDFHESVYAKPHKILLVKLIQTGLGMSIIASIEMQ